MREIELGTPILGRYILKARLGEGGQGTVFMAVDEDQQNVAVKIASGKEGDDRLRLEADRLSRINLPSVPCLLDAGVDPVLECFCIVTELALGAPMSRIQPRRRRDAWVYGASIAAQLAATLEAVHAAGVVVRDLHPDNVLLAENLSKDSPGSSISVRLVDFGLARRTAEDETRLTDPRLVAGTPGFTAPEWVEDAKPAPAADIYSLGAVMFYWFTGRPPFISQNPETTYAVQMSSFHPPFVPLQRWPESTRKAVEKLLNQTLASEPARRPESPSSFARQLEKILERSVSRQRRNQRLVALFLGLTAVVWTTVYWLTWNS